MMTAMETVLKLICDNKGAVEYERLLEITTSVPEAEDLDVITENNDYFAVIRRNSYKEVIVRTNLILCKRVNECQNTCKDLHLCRFYILGECSRRFCNYGHILESEHNSRVLQERNLCGLSKDQLCILLLQSDSSLLPPVCVSYNKGSGEFGNCPDKEACRRLHVCGKYIRGTCDGTECNRCHDFYEPHPMNSLQAKGVSSQLIGQLLLIYRNILALKDSRNDRRETGAKGKVNTRPNNRGRVPESIQRNAENVICLSFVKGYCKNGDKCWRIHFDMPYKWEVEVDQVWSDLPDNELLERDYCEPSKVHSVGTEPVCFDTMVQGLHRVRRLSTESSVLKPTFVLTTKWIWYWENEYKEWIEFGSIKKMHRLSSITSEELEQKYQDFLKDSNKAALTFSAGKQFYELNFKDMKQRNEITGTERMVRRRPKFLSPFDVQKARASGRGGHSSSHRGVPGFWDKTAVPDSGFRRVPLSPSDKDYTRVQEHFHKTMKDFSILSIKRIQNKELWEDFQTKRERMKKANKDKKYAEGERLLFHGTKSMHIDDICNQNFDMRVSGANATVYGEGSYFARDAEYSHEYTDKYGEKSMFACRVLVGHYTKGASYYRRPPAKNAAGTLYDSCVNDVREPTIFVIFEKSQVYPEFLITYELQKFPQTFVNSPQCSGFTFAQSSALSAETDITLISKSTLTDICQNSAVSVNVNESQTASMITTSSVLEKNTIPTSSTSTEPALTSYSTTDVRNPLIAVIDSTVSQTDILVSSNPENVVYPEPGQCSAKFISSDLPSKSGATPENLSDDISEKANDNQLISLMPSLSVNTADPESAKITVATSESFVQDSQKSVSSPVFGNLENYFTDPSSLYTSLNFEHSFVIHPSAKASRDKASLSCDKSQKAAPNLVTEATPLSFPQDSPKTSSFSNQHPKLLVLEDDILDSLTVKQKSPTNTTHFSFDHSSSSPSVSARGSGVSVSYKASSPSSHSQPSSRVSLPHSSEYSVHQTASSAPSSRRSPLTSTQFSSPPHQPQKKQKAEKQNSCVVQ